MAVIHYQFEVIHPFYDGNGRTGRIINMLYLVQKKILDIPILYMSHFIIKNKDDYYSLLQEVQTKNNWENWILLMLIALETTAYEAISLIQEIKLLMITHKYIIRDKEKFKFYSQDLLNILFKHPYTKIEFLEKALGVHRQTATKYLEDLSKAGMLTPKKIGKYNFYINKPLL